MKISFIYSFLKLRDPLNDTEGLPLSTPILLSNIKDIFSDIYFSQIDLNIAMRRMFVSDKKMTSIMASFEKYINERISMNRKKKYFNLKIKNTNDLYTDNRIPQSYLIPDDYDLKRAEKILRYLDLKLKLFEFDHYFLTVYKPDELDLIGMFLTAMYLKKNYPQKKIVVGGLHNFTDFLNENQDVFHYIDAVVFGYAEGSIKKLISDIRNDKIKKVYKSLFSYKDILKNPPDYGTFRQLDFFRMKNTEIKNRYFLDFTPSSFKDLLIIPYEFSVGCFWNKCAYCGSSCDDFHRKLYIKPSEDIVKDLKIMKKKYDTDAFVFYNQNFNQSISDSKKILEKMIKSKIKIKWMDMFNIVNIDDEMIGMLKEAGCIRIDMGVSILNPSLQKFYNNILQDNKQLEKLKKISETGIWLDINIITNMPYDFNPKDDIDIIRPYFKYIDSFSLNNFRIYSSSNIYMNYKKYKIKKVDEVVKVGKKIAPLCFIEKNFPYSMEKRKKMFAQNFIEWEKVLNENNIVSNLKLFPLIMTLYKEFSFEGKDRIKREVLKYYRKVKQD